MQQIITMGWGGFSMETTPALDKYVITQTGVEHPKVCFLAQASGESLDYTVKFYRAFTNLGAIPSHLSLFSPHTADIEDFLMSQQAIYVGGGRVVHAPSRGKARWLHPAAWLRGVRRRFS